MLARIPESLVSFGLDEIAEALRATWGNISEAAERLGVPPRDLRHLVRSRGQLVDVIEECQEHFIDQAEAILRDPLTSENELRRDVAARFVLSGRGTARGWARRSPTEQVTVTATGHEMVQIKWMGENDPAPAEDRDGFKLIEGKPALMDP